MNASQDPGSDNEIPSSSDDSKEPATGAAPPAGGSTIPPFEELNESPGGLKAIAQLFLVPALIVVAAGGIFLAMNFLVGGESSPEDLLDQAASGDSRRRGQAAFELSKVIARDPQVVEDPSFRARLLVIYDESKSGGVELRRYLTRVLSLVEVEEAIPSLIEATWDDDDYTQLFAVVALGNLEADAAVPRLIELTVNDDPGLRIVAVNALGNIGDPRGAEALEARLADPAPDVTWNAANALAHMGGDAGEGILIKMLEPGYLISQPGITEVQTEQAMFMAIEGLAELESVESRPERRRALEAAAESAPFPRIQDAARTVLIGGESS